MPTVVVDVGSSTANSYATVAEADAYFESAYGRTLWLSIDEEDKGRLLISASRYLDQFIDWAGYRYGPTQSMAWPRTYVEIHDHHFPNNEIPNTVKVATFELAYHMFESGTPLSFDGQAVDRVKVGPIDVEFSKGAIDEGLPKFIEDLVGAFGTPIRRSDNRVRVVRLIR